MTFAVNYVGFPFNTPIKENKTLFKTLVYSSIFTVLLALDIVPGLQGHFSLVNIPEPLLSQVCEFGQGH